MLFDYLLPICGFYDVVDYYTAGTFEITALTPRAACGEILTSGVSTDTVNLYYLM